ncbi:MAG: HvfC/BufC family peptide modification chaperone [Polaromonas sp.]
MSAAAGLLHEQQSLLRALLGDRDDSRLLPLLQGGAARESLAHRGLQAYQANGLALAERALAAAYPVIAQLIGDESFAPLARHFWRRQPPQRGDIACWGGALADFLEAAPQLAGEPFLGDVARIEWALHRAASAADVAPDPQSYALLSGGHSDDSKRTTLTLCAGVALLASPYPVVSTVNAHLRSEPALAQVAELLRSGVGEHALVWRQGFKPRVRISNAAEHALLSALQAGLSLESSLGRALETAPAFDFEDWLGQSVQTGLVTGAHLLPQPFIGTQEKHS